MPQMRHIRHSPKGINEALVRHAEVAAESIQRSPCAQVTDPGGRPPAARLRRPTRVVCRVTKLHSRQARRLASDA
jgi:hypothetical protein